MTHEIEIGYRFHNQKKIITATSPQLPWNFDKTFNHPKECRCDSLYILLDGQPAEMHTTNIGSPIGITSNEHPTVYPILPKWEIQNTISGASLGKYPGNTAKDALDALARDAGYPSWDAVESEHPSEPGEIIVTKKEETK